MQIPIIQECRPPIRLLVMDRRPVYARGLEMLLAQSPELEVVNEQDVDVVLLSGVAPRTGALAALARVRETNAHAATVMLVEGCDAVVRDERARCGRVGHVARGRRTAEADRCDGRGASGKQSLRPADLAGIHRETRVSLSDRELEVLRLAGGGASPHAISRMLNISKSATRTYLSGAIRKMGAQNRADAVRAARGLGWL